MDSDYVTESEELATSGCFTTTEEECKTTEVHELYQEELERNRILMPDFDPEFDCNVNTKNLYNVEDVYSADFEGEALGNGGYGTVFKGQHLFIEDMPVAIKLIDFEIRKKGRGASSKLDHENFVKQVEKQVAEIQVLREFRHTPQMVHLHEYFVSVGKQTTSLMIVTEFLEGGELFDCIVQRYKRKEPFREGDVRDIFRCLLEAVQFMHGKNVIHRDLKPSNLLLQAPDEPTSLKVADFGQSKRLMPGEKTMTICGTPGYRPPELWEKKPYDKSADIFSSGVILFFLLAGYQPFSSYYKQHEIPMKTIRCEYMAEKASWKRVSDQAKGLVKGLLVKADMRMSVQHALEHRWMQLENDACLKGDLTENFGRLQVNLEEHEYDSPKKARYQIHESGVTRVQEQQRAVAAGEQVAQAVPEVAAASVQEIPEQLLQQQQQGAEEVNYNSGLSNHDSQSYYPSSFHPGADEQDLTTALDDDVNLPTGFEQTSTEPFVEQQPPTTQPAESQRNSYSSALSLASPSSVVASASRLTSQASLIAPSLSQQQLQMLAPSSAQPISQTPQESSASRLQHQSDTAAAASTATADVDPAENGAPAVEPVADAEPGDGGCCGFLFGRGAKSASETPPVPADPEQQPPPPGTSDYSMPFPPESASIPLDHRGEPVVVAEPQRLLNNNVNSGRNNYQRSTASHHSTSSMGEIPTPSMSAPSVAASNNYVHLDDPTLAYMGPMDEIPAGSQPLLEHLMDAVQDSNSYTEAVARKYAKIILQGIARLHEAQTVHRNISFDNLLVPKDGESVIFRDMRYATSIFEPGEDCLTGYCGTPYRTTAPEVYTDFTYNEKVDLWSLGIATYALLCGVDPFHGVGHEPELRRLNVEVYFPFSDTAPTHEARDFVLRLLRPSATDRPSALEALAHDWMELDDEALQGVSLEFAFEGISQY